MTSNLKYPDFKGPAKKIDDVDLPALAFTIGCGEDELHPLLDVETSGGGFDSKGRPKMLFEPHKFYAHLKGAELTTAISQGLAYRKWGEHPYPSDSYPRLMAAMKINPEAALMSCSWQMGQVLGEYYHDVGYDTVYDMVNAACEDEENGLKMMVEFIKTHHLDDDLRAMAALKRKTTPADWAPIARVYNGAGYATNHYHEKLSTAYNKWRGIPDTPWKSPDKVVDVSVDKAGPTPGPMTVPLSKTEIETLQQALRDKGYIEVGKVDGLMGKNTLAAIAAFEIANNLPLTGQPTADLCHIVNAAPMRPVSEDRANATTKTLAEDDKKLIAPAVNLRNIGGVLAATTGLGAIFDGGAIDLDHVMNSATKLHAVYVMLGNVAPWLIGLGVSVAVIYFSHDMIAKHLAEYRKGTLR